MVEEQCERLAGTTAEIVTVEENYTSLKNALKECFDNKRLCVQSHFNDILALEIHTSDSVKGLRAFVDSCLKHVRALKVMGLKQNSFSESLLINILMKKLDRESRRQFQLSLVSSDLPTWREFVEFLEKRCLVLENIQGESKQIARHRLDCLIKKLNKNPQLKKLYSKFIEEYEALGHMEKVVEDELPETNYFLPYGEESTSTRLRVVLNASSNGVSLNDLLFKVVPHQRNYLRILWFDENSHQEVTFRLKTVTYGTSCAPHLAIRTIKQLALDEALDFPLASEMVLRDLYMDDVITGASDIPTAQILQHLINVFATAGMSLHNFIHGLQTHMNF
ncbi:hypothetical protein HNY73_004976 [Argiope bruennichi]|uniref:Reverse transcriptase domain-containing protein n=1 Tax=Argiope bruennichi TaxID=94029 RepID=A0A8T0FQP9_ARGBR|nr:hypothetical protein HNY73_004976 [Argiope bruennichi]